MSFAFAPRWPALRAFIESLASLDGRLTPLRSPGAWWWTALALGAAVRALLVLASEGTYDVLIWQSHAGWTRQWGLVEYYQRMEAFNQPPFIAYLMSLLWVVSETADLPFRVLLRAPTALLDLGTALLLVRAFRGAPYRWVVSAAYWLHPLALIFSAQHGNTDSSVAFFVLLAVIAAGEGRGLAAAVALGLGAWVKLPVALALPAILFAQQGWRARLLFGSTFGAVAISTYLPALLAAPGLVAARVFGYGGASITTPDGLPIWGVWNVFGLLEALPEGSFLRGAAALHAEANALVCWAGVLFYAWLRREEMDVRGLGTSVCGSLAIFYALNVKLAFQYFAWSLPFWFFPGAGYLLAMSVAVGGYVYAVYAFVCDSLLLLGRWDFAGHPSWPEGLVILRDASLVVCAVAAAGFLASALRARRGAGREA